LRLFENRYAVCQVNKQPCILIIGHPFQLISHSVRRHDQGRSIKGFPRMSRMGMASHIKYTVVYLVLYPILHFPSSHASKYIT
jgi:hypothetical protein